MNLSAQSKIFLALTGLAIVGGVLIAQYFDNQRLTDVSTTTSGSQENLISEIVLAALKDPAQAGRENPALVQSGTYTTNSLLALQITTEESVENPLQFTARLLNPTGAVVPLDPPSFTVKPGTSIFCCWQIDTPADYILQIFRPEGTITSIPVKVRQGSAATNPASL